jgi:hypothetical protein
VPDDELTDRNVAALHEIAARGGPLVVVTHAGVDLGDLDVRRIDVPRNERELVPILLTIPLQVLAYHAALTSATTSTSRATWPRASPSSDRGAGVTRGVARGVTERTATQNRDPRHTSTTVVV